MPYIKINFCKTLIELKLWYFWARLKFSVIYKKKEGMQNTFSTVQ